jgi:hypothetical protein
MCLRDCRRLHLEVELCLLWSRRRLEFQVEERLLSYRLLSRCRWSGGRDGYRIAYTDAILSGLFHD